MRFNLARFALPSGDAGIEDTVAKMRLLIQRGAQHPRVQAQAQAIAASVRDVPDAPLARRYAILGAVRQWVDAHFEFQYDPINAELLYSADAQLQIIAARGVMRADCDDAAILYGALSLSLGYAVCVVCVGFSDTPKGLAGEVPFTHTWSQAAPTAEGLAWIEGDVTRQAQAIPVDRIARVKTWPLFSD